MPRNRFHLRRTAKTEPRPGVTPVMYLWHFALVLLLLGLAATALTLTTGDAHAQTKEFHFEQYNADITILPDGSMDITETLGYIFENGIFSSGTRNIPLGRVESLTGVKVYEVGTAINVPYTEYKIGDSSGPTLGTAGTFLALYQTNQIALRWYFAPRYFASDTKTFLISYHVTGGIRVYQDHDKLDWNAIPADTGSTIGSSRVTVTLPAGLDIKSLHVASDPPSQVSANVETNTLTWAATNIKSGLRIGVDLPKGALQVSKPGWQDRVEAQEQALAQAQVNKARQQAVLDLVELIVGLLILVLGPLSLVWRWYKFGRDLPVSVYSDYVNKPPSKLPPGLVGTLLDESADLRDVVSTIVDQGRKHNLTMTQQLLSSDGIQYTKTGDKTTYDYEQVVLDTLFVADSKAFISDPSVLGEFRRNLQEIYGSMYNELVNLGYFPENPEKQRALTRKMGIAFLIAGVLFPALLLLFSDGFRIFPLIPGLGLIVTGIVWIKMAPAMPRKTDMGAEEAQKWRAFQRFLQDIKKYTDLEAAAGKFQLYLPYAIAFGIEKELTDQFAHVPAAMPEFYIPYVHSYTHSTGRNSGSLDGIFSGDGSGNTVGMDSIHNVGSIPQIDAGTAMQNMSDSLGSAMQGMSDSFTNMFNNVAGIFAGGTPGSGGGGDGWEAVGTIVKVVGAVVEVAGGFASGSSGGGGGSAGAD